MKKHIFCALIVLLLLPLAAAAQAITWRPLLGPAEPASVEQRTPLGVRYIAYGFDKPKTKRIKKTVGWMTKRGVPNSLIEEYRSYALKLTENRNVIPQMIDDAFKAMRQKYVACGGKWKVAAERVKPSDLLVKVEAAPIWSEHWNTYAAGFAWNERNLIQAVNVTANSIMTNPKQSGPLRKFSDLMFWEAGNWFAFKAGHKINTLADEKGDSSPCSTTRAALSVEPRETSRIEP